MSGYKSLALASQALLVLSSLVHGSVASPSGDCPCSPNPTTTIVVYIQPVRYTGMNTNYTNYPVAGIQGTNFSLVQFGTIHIFDDPVTIAASPTSTTIGRLQGIFIVADFNGGALFTTATIQFTGGQYANSSLNMKGLGTTLVNAPGQRAIVGGTNSFVDAIGNMTIVEISRSGLNSVLQFTINTKKAV